MTTRRFQTLIWRWYRSHGRHDLPWRKFPRSLPAGRQAGGRQAYRILVSEVMLQQTQVSRVLRKYPEFIRRFPTIVALKQASLSSVLLAWQGMGYNRRALYLKQIARIVLKTHGGRMPHDPDELERLPGIGPGTAGAIAAFAFDRPVAFIETNIRRVFIHHFFGRRRRISDAEILIKIQQTLPRRRIREWYYALMDYGALGLKGIPNPNRRSTRHTHPTPFAGSNRELRGRILAAAVHEPTRRERFLRRTDGVRPAGRRKLERVLGGMVRDGLLEIRGELIALPHG
ncbi:MAG: A/G-specific adenine glycosylase [bacterium]|nr:A/G-specific adenine glycosylase [bacterium]